MGGGFFPYPKWVWTPAGGWYCHPVNWQHNTKILLGGWVVLGALVFNLSRGLERRLNPPDRPIPSQMWCKHANADDPGCVFGKKSE